MDRFGKLFGRKTDEALEKSGDDGNRKPGTVFGNAPSTHEQDSPEVFGLKFVFDTGEARTFTRLPISIGRAEDNDLVLNDESVSAYHARVLFDERVKDVCIMDLDSLNGVLISDQPTYKNVLHDGARIGLGKIHLVFRDTGYIHTSEQDN